MVKRRPVEILRSALCHVAQGVSLRALEPSPGTDLPQMVPAIFPMISGLRACPRAARGPAWHSGCDLSRDGSWRWAADGYRGGWVGHGVAGVAQEPVGNEHSSWGDGWGCTGRALAGAKTPCQGHSMPSHTCILSPGGSEAMASKQQLMSQQGNCCVGVCMGTAGPWCH